MKLITNIEARWKGFLDTIVRFPITIILLVATVITNAFIINIQKDEVYTNVMIAFIVGAFIYAVCQLLYERFFHNSLVRFAFMGIAVIITGLYYLLLSNTGWEFIMAIRTIVLLFTLLVAFLWIPVIKSRISFNESFMAAFKAFFLTVFFMAILFLGTSLILGATNMLIIRVDEKAYGHAANIIFVLLAPIYFLSLIPFYPKSKELEWMNENKNPESMSNQFTEDIAIINNPDDKFNKLIMPAKFLETLVSYIIIPLTAVFTIILLLYIILNITKDFWSDNLMEPLLISYSITVIIVYFLASNMKNAFAKYFKMIFPKVLVPVVLLQTLSSIIRINELGITHGRYFVVLFGVFAIITGILFCFLPVRNNGIIAPILIILSVVAIIPPTDAFSISRMNQSMRLQQILMRNGMIEGDIIIPKSEISKKDQEIIISAVNYLNRMEYTKDVKWLSTYQSSNDFEGTFGFAEYPVDKNNDRSIYISRIDSSAIPIGGYEYIAFKSIYYQSDDFQLSSFKHRGNQYTLQLDNELEDAQAIILEKDGLEILRFDLNIIFNKASSSSKTQLETDELTFTQENSAAVLTVIAQSVGINEWENGKSQNAEVYILVHLK